MEGACDASDIQTGRLKTHPDKKARRRHDDFVQHADVQIVAAALPDDSTLLRSMVRDALTERDRLTAEIE